MNVINKEEAHDILEALSLGQAKMMELDFIPLGPITSLRFLLNENK